MLAEAIRPLAAAARYLAAARRLAVDLVLPPTGLACRHPAGEAGGLCPDCWTRAGFIERPFCERLGTPFPFDAGAGMVSPAAIANPPAYERARAAWRYGDVGRELVHLLKYGDRLDLVRPLGRWMARAGAELLADADALAGAVALDTAVAAPIQSVGGAPPGRVHDCKRTGSRPHSCARARDAAAGRARTRRAGAQRGGRIRGGARGGGGDEGEEA